MMSQNGVLMRIYLAESTTISDRPASKYLIDFFMKSGLPGCTVYRGMSGFGHDSKLHTVDVFQFSLDLPVIIEVVDTKEKIMAILPEIEKNVEDGLIILQDVQMIKKIPDKH